jgi:hypothetical protein
MGADGTMADYCDVLRSRNADDKLAVQVLRFEEDVRLSGEFNGDELAAIESLGSAVEEETGPLEAGSSYSGFTQVSDDSGTISVEIPNEWTSVDGAPITLEGGGQWANLTASTNVQAYNETWNTPGVSITAAAAADVDADLATVLGQFSEGALGACTDDAAHSTSASTISSSGTTATLALHEQVPALVAGGDAEVGVAAPRPGPLTTQPMTATCSGILRSPNAAWAVGDVDDVDLGAAARRAGDQVDVLALAQPRPRAAAGRPGPPRPGRR